MTGPTQVGELYVELRARSEQLAQDAAQADRALRPVEKSLTDVQGAAEDLGKGLSDLGGTAQEATGGLSGVGNAAEKAAESVKKAGRETVDAGKAAEKASGSFLSFKNVFGLGVGAAITAVATAAVGAAVELERAVSRAASGSAVLRSDMERLRDVITTVSQETGDSFEEIGEAATAISRNGVSGFAELEDRLRVISDLSRVTGVGMTSLAASFDQVVDVFGLGAGDVQRVAEALFRLSQSGVPIDDLMRSLQAAAPTLTAVGVDFDTATKALARLIDTGLSGPQAAKAFKQLADGSQISADELRKLAAEMDGVTPKVGTLHDTVEQLKGPLDEVRESSQVLKTSLAEIGRAITPVVAEVVSWAAALAKVVEWADKVESAQRNAIDRFFSGSPEAPTSAPIVASGSATPTSSPIYATPPVGPTKAQIAEAKRSANTIRDILTGAAEDISAAFDKLVSDGMFADLNRLTREYKENLKALADSGASADQVKSLGDYYERLRDILIRSTETWYNLPQELKGGGPLPSSEGFEIQLKGIDYDKQRLQVAKVRHQTETQLTDALAEQDEVARRAAESQAQYITRAIDGALDLANAFGLVDDEIADILSGIGQVAAGLGPLSAALKSGTTGDIIGAGLPVVGGVASVISGLISSFGESPELKAAREAIEANIHALKENTAGLLSLNSSGSEIAQFRQDLAQFMAETLPQINRETKDTIPLGRNTLRAGLVAQALDDLGISMEELKGWANQADLEFVSLTGDTLPQFLEFLSQLGIQLDDLADRGLYSDTAEGILRRTRDTIRFSPETETTGETAQAFVDAANEAGATFIQEIFGQFPDFDFADLDSDDPAIKSAAQDMWRQIIGQIYDQVSAEGFETSKLGDFSPQGFLDWLGETLDIVPTTIEESVDSVATAADRWRGAMEQFGRTVDVFDLTPVESFQLWVQQVGDFLPDVADALSRFDLTTESGLAAAKTWLIEYYQTIDASSDVLAAAGLTIDDVVNGINLAGSAFQFTADAAKDAAEEAARAAENQQRQFEQAARDAERRREEQEREAERAHQEALRRIEEERRARLAVGDDTLRALREQFQLFDVDDQAEQLGQIFNQLSRLSPVFRNLFSGLEATDAGDRAEALSRIKDFVLTSPFGTESGQLSADTVRQQALDVAELIKALNEVTVTSDQQRNESFRIDRSLTEVTGDRMAGLLGTGNALLEEQLGVQHDILSAILAARPLLPLVAPALSATGPGVGIGSATINLYVELNGRPVAGGTLAPATVASARSLSAAIANDILTADLGG